MKKGRENISGKLSQANGGSKSNNFETDTRTDDLALANILMTPQKEENDNYNVNDIIVYENGATSIDFMMPEEERTILEKNLNNYSDMEKMQKALNMAKKNKILSEELRTLELVSQTDNFIENMMSVMTDPSVKQMVIANLQQQIEEGGDITKSIKQLGLTTKALMDAREGMISKIKSGRSGKKARIALKFTNDSGEDVQIGADIDV